MKQIIFDDLASGRIMCLTEISGEFWICFKHPDGQFVTERKANFDDIEKIVRAPKIKVEALENNKQIMPLCQTCGRKVPFSYHCSSKCCPHHSVTITA